jgi:hypothetical protein
MPFHSHEKEEENEGGGGGGGGERERKDFEWRYLPCSCATHKESGLVIIFQPSLEMRAKLTSLIFLMPKPPKTFGM